ncbi:unnamed protein product, partial [Amoebophrya sp. A25]
GVGRLIGWVLWAQQILSLDMDEYWFLLETDITNYFNNILERDVTTQLARCKIHPTALYFFHKSNLSKQ